MRGPVGQFAAAFVHTLLLLELSGGFGREGKGVGCGAGAGFAIEGGGQGGKTGGTWDGASVTEEDPGWRAEFHAFCDQVLMGVGENGLAPVVEEEDGGVEDEKAEGF